MSLVRSTLFNIWFYGLTVIMGIVGLAWHHLGWRRSCAYARVWARLVLGGLRVLCGVRWVITGAEHLPRGGAALIASMHQSAFDTLVWVVLAPEFAYVLKDELTRVPVLGRMLRATGMIPVDRRAGGAAMRGLMRDADRAVSEGRQIIIFPEGTRAAVGARAALHPGVAAIAGRTGLAVIPVATDSGRCWGRRAFRKQPGLIHVAIQPPIPPGLRREALMARLDRAFADGAARLEPAVDKSVDVATSSLAGGRSSTG